MGKAPNYSASPEHLAEQYKNASNLSARQRIYGFRTDAASSWPRWVFDQLDLPANARVLELGCGNGVLWESNADRILEGWEIVLTDMSPGMLEEARKALSRIERRFAFQTMNAESISFPDSCFDAVVANHMLYHVPDRNRAIGEVHRVLRTGGKFSAATNGAGHLRELKDLIDAFVPTPTETWSNDGPFQLDDGEAQLREHFSDVTVHRIGGELRVTEAQAIVDYALSVEWVKPVLIGPELDRFRTEVHSRITRDGMIRIGTDVGLLQAVR